MDISKLKRYDVVTFDEDDKIVVLERCEYNGRLFVYVNEILPDESDVTDVYKIMEIHTEDQTLEKVIDKELLKVILPIFLKKLEAYENKPKSIRIPKRSSNTTKKDKIIAEYDGKKYTLSDYEELVRTAGETKNVNTLVEHSNKLSFKGTDRPSNIPGNFDFTYESWLEFLNRNGSVWAKDRLFYKYLMVDDYDMASWTIECFVKGLEKRGESVSPILYYQIGYYKYLQIDDDLLFSEMEEKYGGKILSAGSWYKKAIEAGFDYNEISDGKWCIKYYDDYYKKRANISLKENGCYIATCVYGSYDCPPVWTLRRFRDEILSKSFLGRAFIKCYYAISPKLVDRYGNTRMFVNGFRKFLDKLVLYLKNKGLDDSFYIDK